jgi:hypothetical protein
MSKIEVNAIEPQCGTTLTVGAAGTTVAVPSNVVKSNALQASDAGNIISQSGTTITLGASGDTINLASGASQSGFGRTGTVDWQTGSIKTGTFVPVSGEGYFVDTSGGVSTANLPAGSAGAIVSFADYTRTFKTNNLTIVPNGSEKIGGVAANFFAATEGQSITLIYVDATEGWINTVESTGQSGAIPAYVVACGGSESTVGDFKFHKFTGPGTFTVTCAGNAAGSNTVQSLVVAGGGGGQSNGGSGGGAGGLRNLACQPVTAIGYTITVGGGGVGGPPGTTSTAGVNSTFSTIISAGGGRGTQSSPKCGGSGGSGGGAGGNGGTAGCGGAGNTPPVSPPQGNPGGSHGPVPNYNAGAGGGGHASAGSTAPSPGTPGTPGGHGGNGTDVSPSFPAPLGGTPAGFYAGGGGGGANDDGPGTGSDTPNAPGGGGEGAGGPGQTAGSGTPNTGGGGGGAPTAGSVSGSGGSGIVIIKYKFQN